MIKTSLGKYSDQIKDLIQALDQQELAKRIWAKDASLWKEEEEIKKKILNRLGWLTIVDAMSEQAKDLMAFARSVKEEGFNRVVLLGMGGSSLCPEVCRLTFGVTDGYPDLEILDTTDPAAILTIERGLDLDKTLFIVASKSGTTLEVKSLYRYFSQKIKAFKADQFGQHFIAITDPGTPLEHLAREDRFRRTFLAESDIGGRYSALSYFGLVPAALFGLDLKAYLKRAQGMLEAIASSVNGSENPGIILGSVMGELGKIGRDKLTIICSPKIASLGFWIEQLVAESTGKEGKGVVPVEGEALGAPSLYGQDRQFVYLTLEVSPDPELDSKVASLEKEGFPVIRIYLHDHLDLAGEFLLWEMATAVAGKILNINPFDEPNVSESKENTAKVLDEYQKTKKIEFPEPSYEDNGISLYWENGPQVLIKEAFWKFMDQGCSNDYVALMAYLERSPSNQAALQEFRQLIRDRTRLATTLGFGPRFLHSTGQLHKGGGGNTLFVQITVDDQEDIKIPGEEYTFGILKQSQALGDFHSLQQRGFRSLQIHLSGNVEAGLRKLLELVGG